MRGGRIDAVQVPYNPAQRAVERIILPLAATAQPARLAENAAAGSPPWFGPDERAYVQRLATAHDR